MSGYDWDPRKAEANRRKHGVTFEEAETVANDPLGWYEVDPDQSLGEQRQRILGMSSAGRLLLVITSIGGPLPRLISARRATKRERHAYEHRRR